MSPHKTRKYSVSQNKLQMRLGKRARAVDADTSSPASRKLWICSPWGLGFRVHGLRGPDRYDSYGLRVNHAGTVR